MCEQQTLGLATLWLTWGSSGRSCSWRCIRPPPTWPFPAPRPYGKLWQVTCQRAWHSVGPRRTPLKGPLESSLDLQDGMSKKSQEMAQANNEIIKILFSCSILRQRTTFIWCWNSFRMELFSSIWHIFSELLSETEEHKCHFRTLKKSTTTP